MSSRGRGYGGRGNYSGRGSNYRGSYRGSRGGYEGGRGGRGGGYSSYNNDSRYNSSSTNRYSSSRDRMDDSYKKPYRMESASYSNRDYGRSGSPERKRMRMEGSSSDRRSHDGGSHYGGSYSSRQESYGGDRRSFASEDRRRSPARESYRKPSGMGPPREPPRMALRRAPRRSFRGRTMRSRASFRGAPRSRGSFASRRFGERSLGYTRAFRPLKRSSIKSKEEEEDEASSTEEDWEADEKEEAVEDKKETKIKSPKDDAEASEGEAGEGGDDTDKEPDAASDSVPPRTAPYVHLSCVHCKEKCPTFSSYAKHLLSGKHRAAMSGVARRHKAQLLRMRIAQRGAQRELEGAAGAELAARTAFCLVCRLNHRTTRHAHNLTDTHRAMKRFLMPFCRICRVTFRSPMIYEHHICSIEHLKKKAHRTARRASPKAEAEVSGDEGMDVDLDNFMTLDSVGDVDEVEDDDSSGEKKEEVAPKKPKVEINIGSEHIKKMEVWWCELCRVYLPRAEAGSAEEAEATRRHCRLRAHLGRYVQHRDTRTLRRHAERIHRQLHQQKGIFSHLQVWCCELCRVYLPRAEAGSAEEAEATRRHCRLRAHLGRYVQHRDTRTLRRHAERIHRQLHQQKEEEKEAAGGENAESKVKVEKAESTGDKKNLENGAEASNISGSEDKLWADVDKDIGELLREVDPQGNEASDDEEDLGRYDKFRKSDKKSKTGDGEESNPKGEDSTNEKVTNTETISSA
ncbi:zinc finger protein on ecdysone puffs isoform X2 [Maniola jurtina]|uniref:zinc finger protein on ecdysone puffs isoform X2 n=1 Tax=Maniola jurtina TaxID=191418 RepID=UPI001E68BAD5|nr:zinc finger protein on ecdysone puffs isoform X2 [Maniola jurtina]